MTKYCFERFRQNGNRSSENAAIKSHAITCRFANFSTLQHETERNIGIESYRIPMEVRALTDDVRYWIAQQTYPADEIAVCLHHRLVAIHPFPNGNGRLTRLMADLLIEKLGRPAFTWGGGSLIDAGVLRAAYIAALRKADDNITEDLMAFARG